MPGCSIGFLTAISEDLTLRFQVLLVSDCVDLGSKVKSGVIVKMINILKAPGTLPDTQYAIIIIRKWHGHIITKKNL